MTRSDEVMLNSALAEFSPRAAAQAATAKNRMDFL
jgi:hypothetical protein